MNAEGVSMKARLFVVCLLFAVSTAWPARATSPISVLNSDELFKMAQGDIAKMPIDELRLFADTLAHCVHDLSRSELIQNECDIAWERYRIEYDSDRTLDELLNSIGLLGS